MTEIEVIALAKEYKVNCWYLYPKELTNMINAAIRTELTGLASSIRLEDDPIGKIEADLVMKIRRKYE